ncbi:hypothetical protein PG997_008717 [Apiospora hydei]|uniref:SET domain-containing protein n=1 Tax=Apiospora hydei TaxID=1337664 RepID=A0ABR1WFG0_9PEZI
MIVSPAQFQRLRDRDKPSADVSRRYNIVETDKGMSVIATRNIPRSTVIIEEKPLIYLKGHYTKPRTRKDGIVLSGLHWQLAVNHLYNAMSLADKAIYDQLYYTETCMAPSEWDDVQLSPTVGRILMRFRTNALEFGEVNRELGVFATASRINHSCLPTAQFL